MSHNEHREFSPSAHVIVHDKSGLYVAVAAIVLSCLNLGMLAMLPMLVDAKIQAGMAEAKEATHQQTAEANAVAKLARSDAGVALDKVEDLRTQLAAKGINVELDGH